MVDDDPLIRAVFGRLLERAGRLVRLCGDGAQALAELTTAGEAIGLLITDIAMPGELDGIELAARALALRPGMPILLMSGDTESLARGTAATGVSATLTKPFSLAEACEAIQKAEGLG